MFFLNAPKFLIRISFYRTKWIYISNKCTICTYILRFPITHPLMIYLSNRRRIDSNLNM